MPFSRKRLSTTVVLAAAAMCASLPFSTAAHATAIPTISLSIDGTSGPDPTVSGVIGVTATVTPAPGVPATEVDWRLDGRNHPVQTIPLQPGQCDNGCTLHWTVDTTAVTTYVSGGTRIPVAPDGANSVAAAVHSGGGSTSTSTAFAVDNHRPLVDSSPTGPATVIHANHTLDWTVHPSVSAAAPAGTLIHDVELEDADDPGLPVTYFGQYPDGWRLSADTSALPTGVYTAAAVTEDTNGLAGNPEYTRFSVDHGFTLDAPSQTVTGPDWSGLRLSYAYHGWAGCGTLPDLADGAPVDIQLQVDGGLWQDSAIEANLLGGTGNASCSLPGTGTSRAAAKPLPLGKHVLTWLVTDSNGVQQEAVESVTVALPLTSDWPTLDQTVVAGNALQVKAKVSAPDGFSKLQSWSVQLNGQQVVASGTGATPPTLSLPTPLAQETGGTVTLHLVSDSGLMSDQTFSYQTGWATAAYAHVSATSVKRGSYVSLYASDWERINGTWHFEPPYWASVQYQWEVPGSGVWHNGPSSVVSPTQPRPAAVQMRVGGNVCFRAQYAQNSHLTPFGYDTIPATSAPVCVAAH